MTKDAPRAHLVHSVIQTPYWIWSRAKFVRAEYLNPYPRGVMPVMILTEKAIVQRKAQAKMQIHMKKSRGQRVFENTNLASIPNMPSSVYVSSMLS